MTVYEFIQINLNLIAFYLFYLILERGAINRVYNRFYLLLAPILAVAIPFIELPFGANDGTVYKILPAVNVLLENSVLGEYGYLSWTFTIYTIMFVVGLLVLIHGVSNILGASNAQFITKDGLIKYYELLDSTPSYSFFNRIYINFDENEDAEIIIEHEKAHWRQLHSIDLIVSKIYESLFWFNPIIRLYTKKMKLNHEYLADQEVIQRIDKDEYTESILATALSTNVPVLSSGFRSASSIYKRVMKLNLKNTHNMKHLMIIPLAACLTFTTVSMTIPSNSEKSTIVQPDDEGTPAEFPGGNEALVKFMTENIKYPKALAKENIQGKVFVEFTISKDGKVMNPQVVKSSGHEAFDDEAIRVINKMPDWEPGMKNGNAVDSKMTLPFMFKL